MPPDLTTASRSPRRRHGFLRAEEPRHQPVTPLLRPPLPLYLATRSFPPRALRPRSLPLPRAAASAPIVAATRTTVPLRASSAVEIPGPGPLPPPFRSPPRGPPLLLRPGPRLGGLVGLRRRGPCVGAALRWGGVSCRVRLHAAVAVPRGGRCRRGRIISTRRGAAAPAGRRSILHRPQLVGDYCADDVDDPAGDCPAADQPDEVHDEVK